MNPGQDFTSVIDLGLHHFHVIFTDRHTVIHFLYYSEDSSQGHRQGQKVNLKVKKLKYHFTK